jgi:hypothetical protein
MKTLINDNNGYKTYVKTQKVLKPEGYIQIEFTTVWENAKYPEGEQTKYRIVLSPDDIEKLKKSL